MTPDSPIGLFALAGRIIGLGLERPLVKALGQGKDSIAATTLYFGLGLFTLLPVIAWQLAMDSALLGEWQRWILPALLAGLIYAVSFHSYVWGLSVGEVSYLAPLYSIGFIFLYLLDLTLGEASFRWLALGGIVLVTLGVVLLNVEPGRPLLEALSPLAVLRQPGAWGMLVYAFGLALARLVDKSAADFAPALPYAFVSNSPCVIAGLAILAFRGRLHLLPELQRERPWIAIIGAASGMYAYVLMLVALDYYNPSVVEPVTQLSVFIAVGLGAWWFKEKLRTRMWASALVVAGAVLLLWK